MIINQQKVEKAVQVLEALQVPYPNGFPKEMKGDISSFGASIIQAGLLPSVLFFSEGEHSKPVNEKNSDEDTKLRRARLMKVVFDVLEAPNADDFAPARPLLDYVRQNLSNPTTALDNITEAALAVKVALRAFKFIEKESKPSTSNDPTT
jgi:CRISPR-associated protein Cmr5